MGLDTLTMRAVLDLLASGSLLVGLFFLFVGSVGVVRLPDAYNRIHAASICVTLGLTGLLLAACYHIGSAQIVSKAIATMVFVFVASPIGSHLLAKAAHHGKLPQWDHTLSDELAADKLDPTCAATDDVEEAGHSSSHMSPPPAEATHEGAHREAPMRGKEESETETCAV